MNANQMRLELLKCYGAEWQSKVRKMPDKQVIALYLKFKREGKIK